jgi:hypothetical protein
MRKALFLMLTVFALSYVDVSAKILYEYTHPDGKKVHHGFWTADSGAMDWQKSKGLSLRCYSDGKRMECLQVSFLSNNQVSGKATVAFKRKGWQTHFIPWSQFDTDAAQLNAALRCVKTVRIETELPHTKLKVSQAEPAAVERIAMKAVVKGRSAKAGEEVVYSFTVANVTSQVQSVAFSVPRQGWEMMSAKVIPSVLTLSPGEEKKCKLIVNVGNSMPDGSREHQQVLSLVNGQASATDRLDFVTAVALTAPNILHTKERWDEVRDKIKKYDWAREAQEEYIRKADLWEVPQIATTLSGDNDQLGPHVFRTQEEHGLMAAAIAYQLTGQVKYAEKVALFMRRLCDPKRGYPFTLRGCSQSFVQEGHFFQHIAMAYDAVLPSGVFSENDIRQIETVFRLFIDIVRLQEEQGAVNNWKLSEMCGALYCSLVLQDWSLVEELLYHPSMIIDHLSHGVMNDGFWYECSVGYNIWCATEFSQVALALEPWGEDLIHRKVSMGNSPWYSLMPDFKKGDGIYGMNFHKWGSVTKNSVCIKDMWDAIPQFADYRGVMLAVNDAQETLVAGESYELAYYLYHDPEYAAIIKRGGKRDLLYGVPELPETKSTADKLSAYADNIGIVNLRSQTENRHQREQIQAYMHYGTHGGYHGHFDRASLLGIMRYGRSFFNPEMVWYGYPSYMYKFYVQTSMDKNMVVVDDKMQLPRESSRKLFYSGPHLQAAMVETVAPWANPPYGGMKYDWANGMTFQQKMWSEGRSIKESADHPQYGAVTDETEPITQRRLMIVTDDYVVLADYLKGNETHYYDNLIQMKGFQGLFAEKIEPLRHDGQMVADCRSAAQFITDCQWWRTEGTVSALFSTGFGEGFDNEGNRCPNSEDGELHFYVAAAWPKISEVMIGTQPEPIEVNKQVEYVVKGDGEVLAQGKSGIWILGEQNIDLDVQGVQKLTLSIHALNGKRNTLFWGNGIITTKDGQKISLKDLPARTINVLPVTKGRDYYGGICKIAGIQMDDAMPAEPKDISEESLIEINLSQIQAEHFSVVLGGDYPLGDETARRKTLAIRKRGKEVHFLTVLEPFESESKIEKVEATDEEHLTVWLKDGRKQTITIERLNNEKLQPKVILSTSVEDFISYVESTE